MAAARKQRDTRKAWLDALAKVQTEAEKAFPEHVGKLGQLKFHIDTASMVVDELHDTTPHIPS
jgi:hypothetical protein